MRSSGILSSGERYFCTDVVQSSRVKKSKKKAFLLDFLTLEDGTDRLSRNVSTEVRLNAA